MEGVESGVSQCSPVISGINRQQACSSQPAADIHHATFTRFVMISTMEHRSACIFLAKSLSSPAFYPARFNGMKRYTSAEHAIRTHLSLSLSYILARQAFQFLPANNEFHPEK